MAAKKIRSQVLYALLHILETAFMLALSVFCGVQVYLHGTGNRGEAKGLKGLVAKWLYQQEDAGNDTLVKGILIGIFVISAVTALAALIYHLAHLFPGQTKLGRSIRKQAKSYEKLNDLIAMIDTDMDRESMEFGTELRIGTQWLLGEEAMRLSQIQNVKREDRRKNHTLTVTDRQGNEMEVSFAKKESLDDAMNHLRRRLPALFGGAAYGTAAFAGAWDGTGNISGAGVSGMGAAYGEAMQSGGGMTSGAGLTDGPGAASAGTGTLSEAAMTDEDKKMRALGFAAPLRDVIYEYEKETGAESTSPKKQEKMKKKLSERWNIQNKEQLKEKIRELYLGKQTAEFDRLLPTLGCETRDEIRTFLVLEAKMRQKLSMVFTDMLGDAEEYFRKYGVYYPKETDTLYAWDLVNAAVLIIHGAKAGFLDEREELEALNETGRLAGLYYGSWDEYAGTFLLAYFIDVLFKENKDEAGRPQACPAGKTEVKEIRNFLRDEVFMKQPFQLREDGRYASLPPHYEREAEEA